jgi:hypothetical protein
MVPSMAQSVNNRFGDSALDVNKNLVLCCGIAEIVCGAHPPASRGAYCVFIKTASLTRPAE